MNTCYIFGALDCGKIKLNIDETDLVIAADGGLKWLNELNITPNFIVGDFDSLNYTPDGNNVIKHPVMKNETDTILAVDTGFGNGFKNYIIYGCLGGRLDQTIASIQTAHYIVKKGGKCVFKDNNTSLTVLENDNIKFSNNHKGIISVFSLTNTAIGVTEKGLLYNLDNETLTSAYPLGVSNEFTGKEAEISVKDGALCIIWEEK